MTTFAEKLMKEYNVSEACAQDIIYLRTRNRWSKPLEQELIKAHKEGQSVNIMSFGCTEETGRKMLEEALSQVPERTEANRG